MDPTYYYRAGDEDGPVFSLGNNNTQVPVLLFTRPEVFRPFNKQVIRIWRVCRPSVPPEDIQILSCYGETEKAHVVNFTKDDEFLNWVKSLDWEDATEQSFDDCNQCNVDDDGFPTMSNLYYSRAVLEYLNENKNHNPSKANANASIKAASLWCFPTEDEVHHSNKPGNEDDAWLLEAVKFSLESMGRRVREFQQTHKEFCQTGATDGIEGKDLSVYEITAETVFALKGYQQPSQTESSSEDFDFEEDVVDELVIEVRRRYLAEMSGIKKQPWKADSDSFLLEDIYTQQPIRKLNSQEDSIQYFKMFKDKRSSDYHWRLAVVASPGMGKTTLVKRIALDWAEESETLDQFKIVLIFNENDLRKTKSNNFEDILCDLPQFRTKSQDEKNELFHFIKANQSKVLMIFDGIDEFSEDLKRSLEGVLNGSELNDCCVLVTARTEREQTLQSFGHLYTKYEIAGFTTERVKSFADKYFCNTEEAAKLVSFLREREISDLGRIPLLMLLFCYLWNIRNDRRFVNEFPDSKTKMYQKVVECLINHLYLPNSKGNYREFESFSNILRPLGEILQNRNKFSNNLLSPDVRKLLLSSVFFTSILDGVPPFCTIKFMHKSLQEFLEAWYMTKAGNTDAKTVDTFLTEQDSLKKFCSHQGVIKFICGLSQESFKLVFNSLEKIRDNNEELRAFYNGSENFEPPNCLSEAAKKFQDLCIDLYMECKYKDKTLEILANGIGKKIDFPNHSSKQYDLLFAEIAKSDQGSFQKVKLRIVASASLNEIQRRLEFIGTTLQNNKLGSPELPRLLRDWLGNDGEITVVLAKKDLVFALHAVAIQRVGSSNVTCVAEKSQGLLTKLLYFLPLQSVQRLSGSYLNLLKCIKVSCVRILTLVSVFRKPESLTMLANALPSVPQLEELNISGNEIGDGLSLLTPSLLKLPKLRLLRLLDTHVTDTSIEAFVKASDELKLLEELALDLSSFYSSEEPKRGDQVVDSFAESLGKLSQLNCLELQDIHLKPKAMAKLGESTIKWGHLRKLQFSNGRLVHIRGIQELQVSLSDEAFKNFVDFLNMSSLKSLQELSLQDVGASHKSTETLKSILTRLPNLRILDLSKNALTGNESEAFVGLVENAPKTLEVLNLNETQMSADDVFNFSRKFVLGHFSNLKKLVISHNNLEGGVKYLAVHLKFVPHLEELNMEDTKITKDELVSLSESFQHIVNLRTLNIADNRIETGVQVVAEHLHSLQSLRSLNLRKTGISKNEVRKLSRVIAAMQNLTKVDLSDNSINFSIEDCIDSSARSIFFYRFGAETEDTSQDKSYALQISY